MKQVTSPIAIEGFLLAIAPKNSHLTPLLEIPWLDKF